MGKLSITNMRVNILAEALNKMVNAERRGMRQVLLRPASKLLVKFLTLMQKEGYIGAFTIIDDHRSNKIVVELLGRINKCGVISPRFDIKLQAIEKWTNHILPSTTYGVMTHEEARRKHTGGKILGFFF